MKLTEANLPKKTQILLLLEQASDRQLCSLSSEIYLKSSLFLLVVKKEGKVKKPPTAFMLSRLPCLAVVRHRMPTKISCRHRGINDAMRRVALLIED